jgi:MFS family permease
VDHYLTLVLVLMVWGAATALTFQASLVGVANSAPTPKQGQAAGIANESQMLGGVFGIAAMSALQVSIGRWDVVFGFAALIAAAALLLGVLTLDRRRPRAS